MANFWRVQASQNLAFCVFELVYVNVVVQEMIEYFYGPKNKLKKLVWVAFTFVSEFKYLQHELMRKQA